MFCDGWAYHQASTREDALKRSALVASGKFWVCSVTWEDVQSAFDEKVETTLADGLDAMCFNSKDEIHPSLRLMLDESLWTHHAMAIFICWLAKPAADGRDQHATKIAHHAGATAFRMVPKPDNAELKEARIKLVQFWNDVKDLPCERATQSVAAGNVNDLLVALRYWWPKELADQAAPIPSSPGFVIYNDAHAHDEPTRHLMWRWWLWIFNIFQTLPGVLLATQAGLEAGDHAVLTVVTRGISSRIWSQGAAHAAAWEEVIEQAMGALGDGLRFLMDTTGLPPPDEVGYELEEAGEVVAESELAWVPRKLALLMPVHIDCQSVWEAQGWKTVVAEGEWEKRLAQELGNHSAQAGAQQEEQT